MASLGSWGRGGAALAFGVAFGASARGQDWLWSARGDNYGDELGFDVETLGDIDFDGVDDIAVSESRYGPLSRFFSGRTGAKLFDIVGIGEVTFRRLGDVNGDGRADVVVEGIGPNYSAIRSGKDGSLLHSITAIFSTAVGDVDGDGIVDLAGYATATVGPALGEVRVFSGVDGHLLRKIAPAGRSYDFGWGTAPVGDRDGDGVTDLAVTVDGTVQSTIGRIAIYSLATGALLASSMNVGAWSNMGPTIDPVGDLDGDGFVDLVCSSCQANPGGKTLAGRVDVLSTGTMGVLASFEGEAYDFLHSEGVVGDVDGDGRDDFVLATNHGLEQWCWSGRTIRRLFALQPGFAFMSVVGRGADLDGDGRAEFPTGDPHTGWGYVHVEHGRPAFLTIWPALRPSGTSPPPSSSKGAVTSFTFHVLGTDLLPGSVATLVLAEADGLPTYVVLQSSRADAAGEWSREVLLLPPDSMKHTYGVQLHGTDRLGQPVTTAIERVSYY